jgi:DNA recombination protein RmuC
MLIVALITGLGLGLLLGLLIANLLNRTKNVPIVDFNAVTEKLSAKSADLIRVQEKLEHAQIELLKNAERLDAVEKENKSQQTSLAEKTATLAATGLQLKTESGRAQQLQDEFKELQASFMKLTSENSRLMADNSSLNDKLKSHKEEILELQRTSQLQFEKIANQILEEKSGKFTEANKANMEAILKPLGENIESFRKKVEEVYATESKERFSLSEKVKELVDQTNKVSAEANNLATALKGQSKKQGNWGEVVLESILQKSGLEKNREYELQPTIKDENGKNLRPDVLVRLPDNRAVIIDSKVSLVAYDKYSSAETAEEQAIFIAEHIRSIKGHIDDLSSKNYDNLESSLDFTMMFIPIEPAYMIAIQRDQDLWSFAYSKRILLISPTNLIACLKLINDLWKRESQSRNAQEIVKRGERLYEKFVGFAESMEEIGKGLDKTQTAFSNAVKQLNSGTGNLVRQAEQLKELGLKSSKQLPKAVLPLHDDDADEFPEVAKNLPAEGDATVTD